MRGVQSSDRLAPTFDNSKEQLAHPPLIADRAEMFIDPEDDQDELRGNA